MTNFWDRLGTDDGGMPAHLPVGVNASGQGPESDATAHHFVCWCGDARCPLTRALALADACARAEVAALRERFRFSEYPNGKVRSLIVDGTHWVSVAYANGQEERGAEKARRDVLADLRAKADECSTVGEVLALIEEAERA